MRMGQARQTWLKPCPVLRGEILDITSFPVSICSRTEEEIPVGPAM